LPELETEFVTLLGNSSAPSTKKAYNSGIRLYHEFLKLFNFQHNMPIPEHIIMNFVAFMSKKGYASKTIAVYVESLSFTMKISSVKDTTKHFLIKKVLEGHRRMNPTKDSRLPITIDILARIMHILPLICYNNYECSLFQGMFLVSFWGLFRVGEITSQNTQNSYRCLLYEDLSYNNTTQHRFVQNSKKV